LNRLFKVIIESFMTRYKRNQIEEGIVRTLGAEGARVADLKLRRLNIVNMSFQPLSICCCQSSETAVAFWAAPNVTDVPFIPIFGPFGGNQVIAALSALHPETGSRIEN
jgi:hypothetical protein